MTPTKEQLVTLLAAWINQRPGLDFANYGDVSAYRAEGRSIARDRKDALQLLRAVQWRDSITAEQIAAAFPRAFSGRLSLVEHKGKPALDYCTGQYWPTEYRKAAAAVLASVLWDHARENMPTPSGHIARQYGKDHPETGAFDTYDGLRKGDWLRRHFKREFGATIQKRWFD